MLKHQKKLIGSALVLLLSLNLTGCASFAIASAAVKELNVFSKPVEKTQLNLELPTPVAANDVVWTVVTPANQDSVWENIRKNNERESLVCLSDKGYENLALTIIELRNNTAQSRAIAKKYKEYYEQPKEQ
jgi:hypothetical protein